MIVIDRHLASRTWDHYTAWGMGAASLGRHRRHGHVRGSARQVVSQ